MLPLSCHDVTPEPPHVPRSGKTLAYLLPLMQQMRLEEQRASRASAEAGSSSSEGLETKASPQTSPQALSSASLARKKSARVIILAPTTELAQQVSITCHVNPDPPHLSCH